jgi:hypothetical protein
MSDIQSYLSLLSALTSSNSVQSLYSNNSLYSASNLYGTSSDDYSFSSIFGNCVDALQSSNTSLLTDLAASLSDNVSDEDEEDLLTSLEEASQDTCTCSSAELVKQLYSAYLSDTNGYAKNNLTQSTTTDTTSTEASTTAASSSSTATSATVDESTIESSIPTEEEIESLIAASISVPA